MKTALVPLALLALASASQALVTYTLSTDTDEFAFVIQTADPNTTVQSFRDELGQIQSGSYQGGNLGYAAFGPNNDGPVGTADYLSVKPSYLSNQAVGWAFAVGSFQANGTYTSVASLQTMSVATLKVAGSPVPEPVSLAALGLGALGMLRRHKRR